jgi:hypothetical protein
MVERARGTWYVRPLGALAVLVAEYLTISFAFDAQPLLQRAGVWRGLAPLGLATVLAIITTGSIPRPAGCTSECSSTSSTTSIC